MFHLLDKRLNSRKILLMAQYKNYRIKKGKPMFRYLNFSVDSNNDLISIETCVSIFCMHSYMFIKQYKRIKYTSQRQV